MPYCKDRDMDIIQWPPFLLASKVYAFYSAPIFHASYFGEMRYLCFILFIWLNFQIPIALDMAADSEGKDRDLKKRVKSDPYFTYAIKECYASFKNIIYTLVVGAKEREYVLHSHT